MDDQVQLIEVLRRHGVRFRCNDGRLEVHGLCGVHGFLAAAFRANREAIVRRLQREHRSTRTQRWLRHLKPGR